MYLGFFCVVVNFYKCLFIYMDKVVDMYCGRKWYEVFFYIYVIIDNVYWGIKDVCIMWWDGNGWGMLFNCCVVNKIEIW